MRFVVAASVAIVANGYSLTTVPVQSSAMNNVRLSASAASFSPNLANRIIDTVLQPEMGIVGDQAEASSYEAFSVLASSANNDLLNVATVPLRALAVIPVAAYIIWKTFKDDDELAPLQPLTALQTRNLEDQTQAERNRRPSRIASAILALLCTYGSVSSYQQERASLLTSVESSSQSFSTLAAKSGKFNPNFAKVVIDTVLQPDASVSGYQGDYSRAFSTATERSNKAGPVSEVLSVLSTYVNKDLLTVATVPLIALAVVPVTAFLIWQIFDEDEDMSTVQASGVSSLNMVLVAEDIKSEKARRVSAIASMKADLIGRVENAADASMKYDALRLIEERAIVALQAAEDEATVSRIVAIAAGYERQNAEEREFTRLAAVAGGRDTSNLMLAPTALAMRGTSAAPKTNPFYKKPASSSSGPLPVDPLSRAAPQARSSIPGVAASGQARGSIPGVAPAGQPRTPIPGVAAPGQKRGPIPGVAAPGQSRGSVSSGAAAAGQARPAPSNPFYKKPASSASRPLPVDPLSKQRESPPMPPQAKSGIPGVAAPGQNRGAVAVPGVAAAGQARTAPSNPFYKKPGSSPARPLPVDPLSAPRAAPQSAPQTRASTPATSSGAGAAAASYGQARPAPKSPFYKKPASSVSRPLPVDPLSAPRAAPQSAPQVGGGGGGSSYQTGSTGAGAAAAAYGQARPAPKSPFYKKPASSVSRPLPVDPLSRQSGQSAPQAAGGGGGGGSSYQTGSTGAGTGAAAAAYGQRKSPFYKKPASSASRPLPVDPLSRQSGQSAPQAAGGGGGGGGGSSYQTGSTGAGTGAAAAAYGQRKSPFYKKPASSVSRPLPVDPLSRQSGQSAPQAAGGGGGGGSSYQTGPTGAGTSAAAAAYGQARPAPKSPFYKKPSSSASRPLPIDPLSKQRESPPMAPSGRAGVSGVAAAGQPRASGVAAAGQPKTNPFYKKPASSASRPLPVDPLSKQRESPPMPPQGRTSIPGVAAPGQSRGSPQAAPQSRGGAVSNQGRAAPKSPFYKKPASSSSRPLPVDPLSARSFRTVASSIDMNTFDSVMHTTLKLESTGKVAEGSLQRSIMMLAKVSLPRLRELIQKFSPSTVPAVGGAVSTSPSTYEDGYLQVHLKAAVEALRSACDSNSDKLLALLKSEIGAEREIRYRQLSF